MNICEFPTTMNPWPIEIQVTNIQDRSKIFTDDYTWEQPIFSPSPRPPSPTKTKCTKRPEAIKFSIVPTSCGDDSNELKALGRQLSHKSKKYYSCKGSPPTNFPVSVVITGNKGNQLFSNKSVARQNTPQTVRRHGVISRQNLLTQKN